MKNRTRYFTVLATLVSLASSLLLSQSTTGQEAGELADSFAPLTELTPEKPPVAAQVALGKQLFFDKRLSGDATISCSTCHDPDKAWTDELSLAKGYPGSLYFRNTPSLLNVAVRKYAYWDGRLPTSDLPTIVRDHISESHFMQADGRLVIERLRQVPEYEKTFNDVFGGEPSYGRILNSVAAFVSTVKSEGAPFERFLKGDEDALSAPAKQGWELFRGKAKCIRCHKGPLLSDQEFHSLGKPSNQEIFATPLRHITFRRFLRTLGVANYRDLRKDPGLFAVTKQAQDMERFLTPSLWDVGRTAPYMHDGSLADLKAVIEFYNRGGGELSGKTNQLEPLNLTDKEKAQLLAALESLSSPQPEPYQRPTPPSYQLREPDEEP